MNNERTDDNNKIYYEAWNCRRVALLMCLIKFSFVFVARRRNSKVKRTLDEGKKIAPGRNSHGIERARAFSSCLGIFETVLRKKKLMLILYIVDKHCISLEMRKKA